MTLTRFVILIAVLTLWISPHSTFAGVFARCARTLTAAIGWQPIAKTPASEFMPGGTEILRLPHLPDALREAAAAAYSEAAVSLGTAPTVIIVQTSHFPRVIRSLIKTLTDHTLQTANANASESGHEFGQVVVVFKNGRVKLSELMTSGVSTHVDANLVHSTIAELLNGQEISNVARIQFYHTHPAFGYEGTSLSAHDIIAIHAIRNHFLQTLRELQCPFDVVAIPVNSPLDDTVSTHTTAGNQ